jgi:AP-4 complex subunit epsilon-1
MLGIRSKISKNYHKIGTMTFREEEQNLVSDWLSSVKTTLSKKSIELIELYENVIALIHLTLLGYNTSFGFIHPINLTQDSQIMTKALEYLACCVIFDSKSDF